MKMKDYLKLKKLISLINFQKIANFNKNDFI